MMPYDVKCVREVTLSEVLDEREKRSQKQKRFITDHKATLISFTMNIAGPIKNTPAIDRAYRYGLSQLLRSLPEDKIIAKYTQSDKCGPFALISIDLDAFSVKDICTSIEEASPIGRLYDIDVLDQSGEKLNRSAPRSCIVCGKPGRECAAGRLHPVEDIVAVTNNIISNHFIAIYSKYLGKIAAESLVREVETTPKPGLVDLRNNGSHSDMSVSTFKESARVLEPYFGECVKLGISSKSESPDAAFTMLRKLGIDAEAAMYDATEGVNTHKGLIYSLGTLLCAIGRLWAVERPIDDINSILREVEMLVSESTVRDLKHASGATAGERLFITKGLSGIRGEVASGFPSVINVSLPAYTAALDGGLSENDAGVLALLSLIAAIDDTNVYNRGGENGAIFAKAYAKKLLNREYDRGAVEEMDDEFISRHLSPGGAADLLAITYFLNTINNTALI